MKIFVLTRKMDDFESTAVATPYLSLEAAQAAMTEDFKDILEVFGLSPDRTSRKRRSSGVIEEKFRPTSATTSAPAMPTGASRNMTCRCRWPSVSVRAWCKRPSPTLTSM